MSLHADLTPETRERLAAQRRWSTITSLLVGLLATILMGVILFLIAMAVQKEEIPELVSYSAETENDETQKIKKVQTQVEKKPAAPSSAMARVIAANTTSPVAIPVPEINVPEVLSLIHI